MKAFKKNIPDRKALVGRLKELTGKESIYTRVPRCAYIVGDFTVEKDGILKADDGADESIIQTLMAEEMIGPEIEDAGLPAQRIPVAAPQTQPSEEAEAESNTLGTQAWEPENTQEAEEETEEAVWQPETPLTFVDPREEAESEETAYAEEPEQPAEEEPATVEEPETGDGSAFPIQLSVSLPLSKHTASSVINLVCMMYARGPLLSLATGGEFSAEKELTDALLDAPALLNAEAVVKFLQERPTLETELKGLRFEEGKVVFDGFGEVEDKAHLDAFTRLAANMNKMAITQKRIQPKKVNAENEKYALRIWLIRLGMNGDDYKADRKILMEHLSGHAAFRTDAEKDKWMARQQAKREALKASREAAEA